AGLPHRAARGGNPAAVVADGYSVAESGAGNHPPRAVRAAGSVSITGSGGQIKGAQGCDIDSFALAFLCGNTIGVAEASSLNLVGRLGDSWGSRAPRREDVRPHQLFGNDGGCG